MNVQTKLFAVLAGVLVACLILVLAGHYLLMWYADPDRMSGEAALAADEYARSGNLFLAQRHFIFWTTRDKVEGLARAHVQKWQALDVPGLNATGRLAQEMIAIEGWDRAQAGLELGRLVQSCRESSRWRGCEQPLFDFASFANIPPETWGLPDVKSYMDCKTLFSMD